MKGQTNLPKRIFRLSLWYLISPLIDARVYGFQDFHPYYALVLLIPVIALLARFVVSRFRLLSQVLYGYLALQLAYWVFGYIRFFVMYAGRGQPIFYLYYSVFQFAITLFMMLFCILQIHETWPQKSKVSREIDDELKRIRKLRKNA